MGRTQTEKLWLAGTGLLCFLLVVIGWFFLVSPQRAKTGSVQDEIASTQLQNTSLQGRITTLTSERAKMASYVRAYRQAQEALPSVDDTHATSDLLRTLQSLAASTSTSVTTVTVGDPVGVTAAATQPATTDAASASSSSTSSESTAAATAAGAPQVYTVAVSATVSGSFPELRNFLTQLQSVQPRAVLITSITAGGQQPVATTTQKHTGARTSLNLTMSAFETPGSATAAPSLAPSTAPGQ